MSRIEQGNIRKRLLRMSQIVWSINLGITVVLVGVFTGLSVAHVPHWEEIFTVVRTVWAVIFITSGLARVTLPILIREK